jgi:hypothetical protein
MPLIQFGQVNQYYGIYERTTEASDLRITENGDTRITNEVQENSAISSIYVVPTYKPLETTAYIRIDGVWKIYVPYVKYNNTWTQPTIYKKISGNWKRVY